MTSNSQRIQPGTNVYGSDGDKIGDVSEVGRTYLLVQKGWLFTRDIYIPTSAIASVDQDSVYLNVSKDQVETMEWGEAPTEDVTTSASSTATYGTTGAAATGTDYAASDVRDTRSTVAATATDYPATRAGAPDVDRDVAIPVVEEELRVGKREVEQGGVRVTTRVEEVPVNEQVTVRDEEIQVARVPVDRPLDPATGSVDEAFTPLSVEMRERDEVAAVDKQARVVEEVVIGKDVQERTETIQDTVQRTDVDVEEIPGQRRTSGYTETARTSASGTSGMGSVSGRSADAGATGGRDEGVIERGLSQAGNAAERATGVDLDRDRDVGQRDPRNNY